MARRQLTDRERTLKLAYERLAQEKAASKAAWRRVTAAKQAIADLSRCDWCRAATYPTAAELQLCSDCAAKRSEEARVALLARHGYDAKGRKVPKTAAA